MPARKISFDGWVLDRESGDLSREGQRQRLQELPLRVLDLLLASPGALVTREQLIAHLWPKGVIDFDTGLNTAVRKLRQALADPADTPKYIETIPRRGYRFIGSIDSDAPLAAESTSGSFPVPQPADLGTATENLLATGTIQPAPNLPGHESIQDVSPAPAPAVTEAGPQPGSSADRGRPGLLGIGLAIAGALALGAGALYWLGHRASAPAASTSVMVSALPEQSVAVLPFENLSTEPNNEFLALGIAEAVLHRLASLHDLTVIARTSSFAFKNRNEDARQIGRTLNARFLVQGSVQRAGDHLRVQSQLVDATSGKQLWSLTFDRQLADIFKLQDEISGRVATQLSVSLSSDRQSASEASTQDLDAYLSYLQGRALVSTGKIADMKLAIERFDRATRIDPQFALAYVQESRAITRLGSLQEKPVPDDLQRAIKLNDRALVLDPKLGEAWVQHASLISSDDDSAKNAEAEAAFRKGLALAPNYGQGFEEFANFLWYIKRQDDALVIIERARQVDPLEPRNHYLKGVLLDESGDDPAQVESLYLQALKLNPTYHPAMVRLGWLYIWRGDYARGLMLHERALSIEPEAMWVRTAAAVTYLALRDTPAAEDVLRTGNGAVSPVQVCIRMLKGDHAGAIAKAYEVFETGHPDTMSVVQICAAAEIYRDALATRHYDRALHALESQYAVHVGSLADDANTGFIWGLPLAQLLAAKGETARATRLAQAVLASTEHDELDTPAARPVTHMVRAGALIVLGDRERALDELENSVIQETHVVWWAIDRGPLFDTVKSHPRYKALNAKVDQLLGKQSELVARMRDAHEVPMRPATVVSAN